jgi:O-succinylbenzoic acid--CoA ligase
MTQDPHGESTPDWLRARALSTPDRLGLIAVGERLTFGELDAAVETTCVALAAAHPGLKSGAWDLKSSAQRPVVALLAGNSAAFVKAIHAVARLNAVLLPLNVRLTPDELAFQVHNASAAVVIADAPRLATAQTLAAPAVSLEQLTQSRAAPRRYEPPPFALSQTMTLIYTSGTTGKPKPAMLTFNNHLASAKASALNLGTGESDRWLAALPLFHIGGLAILLRSVLDGFTAEVHEGFDPARANAAIDDGVTVISVVANMLQRMLDERGERPYPPHLRCVLLGGGPAPRSLLEACAARGVPVVQTYGLTETASQLTTLAPADALRKLGSAGKPLAGNRLRSWMMNASVHRASRGK